MPLIETVTGRCPSPIDRHGSKRRPSRDPVLFSVALILVCGVVALVPLAHASVPDPIWIVGVYDGADYDDVVTLITSDSSAAQLPMSAEIRPPALLRPHGGEDDRSLIQSGVAAVISIRAPPTA